MRHPDGKRLASRSCSQLVPRAHGRAQRPINKSMTFFRRQLHRFIYRGVLGSSKQHKLIKAQAQNVAEIVIYTCGAKTADPKIEKGEIAQHPVKELESKSTVGLGQFRFRENFGNDKVRAGFVTLPRSQ